MMKLLIPILLLLLGTGGGVGAAMFLAPPPAEDDTLLAGSPCGEMPGPAQHAGAEPEADPDPDAAPPGREYAKMNNQFIVPVVADGAVSALVVLSVSIEVMAGEKESVFGHEPRLRDAFLQVLFDHANVGGFDGVFTAAAPMRALRAGLRAAAQQTVGRQVTDVLITDIARQDA